MQCIHTMVSYIPNIANIVCCINTVLMTCAGCAVQFLSVPQPITDGSPSLRPFCESLERILQRGLLVRINAIGYWRDPEPWNWMERLALSKFG